MEQPQLAKNRIHLPSITEHMKEEVARMYKELTDDELIEENKRIFERNKRKEDKMADTGAYEKPKHRLVY